MSDDPNKQIDSATGTELKGHEWDGIQELDTPMPRWWLWSFYATIVFSIGYCIVYPAIPLVNSATAGVFGWTSRGELEKELANAEQARSVVHEQIAITPIEKLPGKPELMRAAVEGGRAAFKVNCVQCHGSGAAGSKGYPNLNDDDWLWAGDLPGIHTTLVHGIREPGNDETRVSMMPAFGRDQILTAAQIDDVVSYVRYLARQEQASVAAQRGSKLFADNCAVCHGNDGKGNREVGAPDLTDPIWLFGGDRAALTETVVNSRNGVMPSWNQRLDPVTVKMLAAYVHSLGGGE